VCVCECIHACRQSQAALRPLNELLLLHLLHSGLLCVSLRCVNSHLYVYNHNKPQPGHAQPAQSLVVPRSKPLSRRLLIAMQSHQGCQWLLGSACLALRAFSWPAQVRRPPASTACGRLTRAPSEPTNDLDLSTVEVLEQLVLGYGGILLVVSHDRWGWVRRRRAVLHDWVYTDRHMKF
jgi:hypothetical protein